MAIIGKIRKQSGLLIGGVGLAMLLFVTDGLFSSGGPFNARQDNEVGEVWGEGISREEFDRRVE
ncbi:MAG: SurA N-terminal domain-containing protein, partial [Bacteroidota bacterium]